MSDTVHDEEEKLRRERELATVDIAAQFAAKAKAQADASGANEQGKLTERALADRLESIQAVLAELEREIHAIADYDKAADTWATWADVRRALMAVRTAQGRAVRVAGYQPGKDERGS